MSATYIALLGDAIGSRALPPRRRARLQRDLRAALPVFNRRWRATLAARFGVTLGDEFQCLLTSAAPVWEIAHTVRAAWPDIEWAIACGRGAVTTLTPGITAPEADGPCFHAARAAMDDAKRRRLLFAFRGFGEDAILNALASYYSALYWSWTPRQRHAAKLLRSGDPAATARRLGVHPSAVSHLRRRLAWPLVAAGDTMFQTLLHGPAPKSRARAP